jgi:hypothetical protein
MAPSDPQAATSAGRLRRIDAAGGEAREVLLSTATWVQMEKLAASMSVAGGYSLAPLRRAEVGSAIAFVAARRAEGSIGGSGLYAQEAFYTQQAMFKGGPRRDALVVLLRRGTQLAGLFACECDFDTLSVYSKFSVTTPAHRGSNLARTATAFAEALGRRMAAGLLFTCSSRPDSP